MPEPEESGRRKEALTTIDWRSPEAIDSLPVGVLTFQTMCRLLDSWKADDVRKILARLNLLTEVPLLCKGDGCDFASTCPLVLLKKTERWEANPSTQKDSRPCPIEVFEAFMSFASYVNTLGIKPEDFVDLRTVNDLVRMEIQMRRCDMLLQRESPVETHTVTKSKVDIEVRQPNQAITVQINLRREINALYKALMANREQKFRENQANREGTDTASVMSALLKEVGGGRRRRAANSPGTSLVSKRTGAETAETAETTDAPELTPDEES